MDERAIAEAKRRLEEIRLEMRAANKGKVLCFEDRMVLLNRAIDEMRDIHKLWQDAIDENSRSLRERP
jgi:hypothetical protein